jgi:hypothetical protein
MTPEESVLYQSFLKVGARKKEMMFLEDEDEDLIVENAHAGASQTRSPHNE